MFLTLKIGSEMEISSIEVLHNRREYWVADILNFNLVLFALYHPIREHGLESLTIGFKSMKKFTLKVKESTYEHEISFLLQRM